MLPSPLEIVFNCYCSFFLEKGYVSNIRCRKENLLEDIKKPGLLKTPKKSSLDE